MLGPVESFLLYRRSAIGLFPGELDRCRSSRSVCGPLQRASVCPIRRPAAIGRFDPSMRGEDGPGGGRWDPQHRLTNPPYYGLTLFNTFSSPAGTTSVWPETSDWISRERCFSKILTLYSKRRLNPTEPKHLRRHRPCKLMMIAAVDGRCAPALSDGRVGNRRLDFSISCYFRVERLG